jgi:hypothetical protein
LTRFGKRQRLGKLTKQGNSLLRYLWTEAVMHAVERDSELKRFYRRKLIQKGMGKARIAAARRLAIAEMKANVLTIRDPNELARWRNNVDLWEAMVGHMERMQKHMESLGPDMMHEHGMGGPYYSPRENCSQ